MEAKIKVTYLVSGMPIQARIFLIYGWGNLSNDLSMQGIMEDSIVKIELVLEASSLNTVDNSPTDI